MGPFCGAAPIAAAAIMPDAVAATRALTIQIAEFKQIFIFEHQIKPLMKQTI